MWSRCSQLPGWGWSKVDTTLSSDETGNRRLFEIRVQEKRSPLGDPAHVNHLSEEGKCLLPLVNWRCVRGANSTIAAKWQSTLPTIALTKLCRTPGEQQLCLWFRRCTSSFWIMKSIAMCLAGIFPKSLCSCSGNWVASRAPSELIANFLVPSECSCCGRNAGNRGR